LKKSRQNFLYEKCKFILGFPEKRDPGKEKNGKEEEEIN